MDERDRRRQARERENGESSDKYTINGKLRKKYTKRLVVDANTTTSHSVLSTGASVKGSSKKINYDALKGVFGGDGGFAAPEAINKAVAVNKSKVAQVKAPPTSKLSGTTVTDNAKKTSGIVNSVTFSSATVDNSKAKSVVVGDEPDDEEEDNLLYEDEGTGGDYEYDDDYY